MIDLINGINRNIYISTIGLSIDFHNRLIYYGSFAYVDISKLFTKLSSRSLHNRKLANKYGTILLGPLSTIGSFSWIRCV